MKQRVLLDNLWLWRLTSPKYAPFCSFASNGTSAAQPQRCTSHSRLLPSRCSAWRHGSGEPCLSGLPEVILRFRRRYPAVTLSVRNMSTSDQLQALRDRSIDIGFVRLPVPAADIETAPFLTERLMVVLGRDHADTPEGLAGLRDKPFIVPCRADSTSFYDHVFRTCQAAGFVPNIVQETDVFFTALNLVRAGLGISIAPSAVQLMRVPQIRFAETLVP